MEITYTLRWQDLLYYQKWWSRRYKKSRRWLRICTPALYALVLIWLYYGPSNKSDILTSVILPLVVVFILWLAYVVFAPILRAKDALKSPQPNTTLRITPEYLSVVAPGEEYRCLWSGVGEIFLDENYIFFMLDMQHGYIVPRSAFSAPAQAKDFYEASLACWNAAKAGEEPPPRVGV